MTFPGDINIQPQWKTSGLDQGYSECGLVQQHDMHHLGAC